MKPKLAFLWHGRADLDVRVYLLLLTILLLSFPVRSQTAVQSWVQRYTATGRADDRAQKIVVYPDGYFVVAGNSDAGLTGKDWVTIKYHLGSLFPVGVGYAAMPIWTNRYDGPTNGDDVVAGMTLDSSGNIIVTGTSIGTGTAQEDIVTIKYSSAGAALWTNRFGLSASSRDYAAGITADGSDNIFVAGYSYGSGNDYVTIALSSSGVPLWTNRYNGTANGDDAAAAIGTDSNGNVFVTGRSAVSGGYDMVTIGYANSGVPLWTNRYNGAANDFGRAIAVDKNAGKVFVTGYSYGTGNTYGNFVTVGYSVAGTPLWTNTYNGPSGLDDRPSAIGVDASGNVFVTGYSYNTYADFATIKYSGAGTPLWTNRFPSWVAGNSQANDLAIDQNGDVIVTGFTPYSLGNEYLTIKYSAAGTPKWTNLYSGLGIASPGAATAVGVDTNGDVFVTGYSFSTNSYDFATVCYTNSGSTLCSVLFDLPGKWNNEAVAVVADPTGGAVVAGKSWNAYSYDYAIIRYASNGVALWTNRYDGHSGDDVVTAMAIDQSSNIFVTGYSAGAGSGSSNNTVTIKYTLAGVALWTNLYYVGAQIDQRPNALTVDLNGNAIVTAAIALPSGSEYLTLKYSTSGQSVTALYYQKSLANAWPQAVAADSSGNFFVTGYSRPQSGGAGSEMNATIKYSSNGTPLWTNSYVGPTGAGDLLVSAATDAGGNVVVAGYSASNGGFDYVTIKYSGAGVPMWTNRYNGPLNSSDFLTSMIVDAMGDVDVTGYSMGNTDYDFATIKYSSNGVPLWTNRYNGPAGPWDVANAVAADTNGDVFVTGYSYGGSSYDYATVGYSRSGTPLWSARYKCPAGGDSFPALHQAIAVGRDGSLFVTGGSDADYAATNVNDFTTIKYTLSPFFVTDPTDKAVPLGTNATFTTIGSGTGPLSLKWFYNGTLIAGATNNSLTVSNADIASQGSYGAVISNSVGVVTGKVASLTIVLPPQFQPMGCFTNGALRLAFSAVSNLNYRVDVSSNLVNWTVLTNVSSTNELFEFSDDSALTQPQRFYRVVYPIAN